MENKLISIVVPIYNVELYIEECINSIINQTYSNLEILLIDDGSPDKCPEICDMYGKKDKRIKVIHKKNGGLSDARNYGINIATGSYITFVDSDDYIDCTYIEKLYEAIIKNDVKVAQCNILKVNNEKEVLEKLGYIKKEIKSGKEMIKELYSQHWIENIVAWNKIYSIDLFDDLRYPKGKIHEDEFTTYKILYELDRISIINEYLYNYRQTNESIVGKNFNIKRLDILEALEDRISYFSQKNEEELYNLTLKCYLETIRYCYMNTKRYIKNSKATQREVVKKYRKNYKLILNVKCISIIDKIKMLIFYLSPNIYYTIIRIINN